jgi:hypothetical protein
MVSASRTSGLECGTSKMLLRKLFREHYLLLHTPKAMNNIKSQSALSEMGGIGAAKQ